jgi:hypothetical protein
MTKTEIRKMDFTGKSVILVPGKQARCVRQNQTASHLTVQFVLPGALEGGDDDLHIFCPAKDVDRVAAVVQEMGGDISKAVLFSERAA